MDVAAFTADLVARGIDIVVPCDVRWYNAHIAEHVLPLRPLPNFDRPDALCLLVGNSSALWPKFLSWLGAQPDPSSVEDPLDTYTSESIAAAVSRLTRGGEVRHDIFWVYDARPERLVSMQRVATTAGVCYHDGETQLAIHPKFGSWLGFRACVVVDAPSTFGASPPAPLGCLLSEEEKAAGRAAMAAALRASDEANLCTQLHGAKGMERDVRLAWAALRDVVGIGREHRYSDDQITYHYTKDKALLMRAVKEHAAV